MGLSPGGNISSWFQHLHPQIVALVYSKHEFALFGDQCRSTRRKLSRIRTKTQIKSGVAMQCRTEYQALVDPSLGDVLAGASGCVSRRHIGYLDGGASLPGGFVCSTKRRSRLHMSRSWQHSITTDSFLVLVVEQLKGCSKGISDLFSIQLRRKWNHHTLRLVG